MTTVEQLLAAGVVSTTEAAQDLASACRRAGVDPLDVATAIGRQSSLLLDNLGSALPIEMATEQPAIIAAIEASTRGDYDGEAAGLAALTPKRAAQKRQAIAQRRARQARR